jgi:hypothetical protein
MFGEGELGCNEVMLHWDGDRPILGFIPNPLPIVKG